MLTFTVLCQEIGWEERLRNDLFLCRVGRKTLTQSSVDMHRMVVSAGEQCIVVRRSSSSISTAVAVSVLGRGKPVFQPRSCVSASLHSAVRIAADERTVGPRVSAVPAARWHRRAADRLGAAAWLVGTVSAVVGRSAQLS